MRTLRRGLLAAGIVATTIVGPLLPAFAQTSTVLVATIEGPITPPTANYIAEGVQRAEREGHHAYLVEIDTPGGLGASMDQIIRAFLGAEVPVIVYVSPSGAQAASAGAFVTMAANVAAMATGTSIGAATPVAMEGAPVDDKIIEAAAASARAIAERRGRNVEFAQEMVSEGRAVTASTAVEEEVVDLVAGSRADLLRAVDGDTVVVAGDREVTLRTLGAGIVEHDMSWVQRIQQTLADPNLAFLFMSIGTLAIIYELANPGMGLGGIIGVILLVLAFFALAVLPVSLVGVLLLLLAAGLFVAELFVPGVGVFAAGGAISLLLAGVFLFRGDFGVDLIVILPTVLVVAGGVVLAGRLVWNARRRGTLTGTRMVAGREALVRSAEGTRGQVVIDGTWWRVRTEGEELTVGQTIRVKEMDGLELLVESVDETSKQEEGQV